MSPHSAPYRQPSASSSAFEEICLVEPANPVMPVAGIRVMSLKTELEGYLAKVHPISDLDYDPPVSRCKAIIAPHAGYSYSGPAAAWAYAAIPTKGIKRVLLLGPSHHFHLSKISLSPFEKYGTPLGDIPLDLLAIQDLRATGAFGEMTLKQDEEEHSLEMHLPYLKLMFQSNPDMRLVPLLVGSVSTARFETYADILSPFWKDPETFFVVSSDFCHWGTRFRHTPYYPAIPPLLDPVPPVPHEVPPCCSETEPRPPGHLIQLDKYNVAKSMTEVEIWRSIEFLDHEGMDVLRSGGKSGTAQAFKQYLDRTGNTICGRNPVSMMLHILEKSAGPDEEGSGTIRFVRYEQSGRNLTLKDSSVSYVSGLVLRG